MAVLWLQNMYIKSDPEGKRARLGAGGPSSNAAMQPYSRPPVSVFPHTCLKRIVLNALLYFHGVFMVAQRDECFFSVKSVHVLSLVDADCACATCASIGCPGCAGHLVRITV